MNCCCIAGCVEPMQSAQSSKKRTHSVAFSGQDAARAMLNKYITDFNKRIAEAHRRYGTDKADPHGHALIEDVKRLRTGDQWMRVNRSTHGAISMPCTRVDPKFYASTVRATKLAVGGKAEAKARSDMAKRASAIAKRDASKSAERAKVVGDMNSMDVDAEVDAFFTGVDGVEERAEQPVSVDDDAELLPITEDDVIRRCANAEMNALQLLHGKIATRSIPGKWPVEVSTVSLSGLTDKLGKCFYPTGCPLFTNIESRKRTPPGQQRHSFMRTCGIASKEHGTRVHEQLDAFVKWINGPTIRANSDGFIVRQANAIDPCLLRVLSTLQTAGLYPVASEVTLVCTTTATFTQADIIVYDLSVEGQLGIGMVELKTGSGGTGDFKTPAHDDIAMHGCMSNTKDTPYMRAAVQLLMCLLFAVIHYKCKFTRACVLHVPKDSSKAPVLYGLPAMFLEPNSTVVTEVYAQFVRSVLNTGNARVTNLRTMGPDMDKLYKNWLASNGSK